MPRKRTRIRVSGRDVLVWGLIAASLPSCSKEDSPADTTTFALPADAATAAQAIDEATLFEVVGALSDDALAGRGPSTRGDRMARQYIAGFLQELGCEPGAPDNAWEQPIALVGITSHMPETWSFHANGQTLDLVWWDEYIAATGVQNEAVAIDRAEVVFVGYGITAPEEDWDDFKGADLSGKVLLVLNNDPDWDPDLFAGTRRLFYGRWTYKFESAARQGAAGAIIIHTTPSAGYPFQVVQTSWTGEQFELPASDEPRTPLTGWVTEEAARKLVAIGGEDLDELVASARSRDFRPVPLGIETAIRFENTINRGSQSANVAGLLRGRDPQLAGEIVVYTAHHDHLGTGKPNDAGDTIYNGARDNASGVATVLAVAKAFAALPEPPRRSVLFLLVGAEEQGLLGSRYFAEHPTVHPGRIAANINVDSPNVFGRTRDVAVIGRGKSGLEDLLESAAALQKRVVVDEPFPDKGYYYRSDQFNFAKIGVPALYFKAGTDFVGRAPEWGRETEDAWRAAHYHQPSDEVADDWDLAGLVEDAQLAFYVGLSVAEADALPAWKPGDEFEDVRKRMLREAAAQ
ncbi:MAG: M20/M25/M40 family metallo-hydrolase [Candidatus Latescibacterota bacterium]|nr:MAG: M20/M25/M40 family metallo-hydrolase [Candidatus Latescibacterota bacterium]